MLAKKEKGRQQRSIFFLTEKDEEAALETLSVPPGINKSSDWPLVSVTSLKKRRRSEERSESVE